MWLNENKYSYELLQAVKEVSTDVSKQADWLKDQLSVQLNNEIAVPCLWQDLLRAAFSQINWVEIVASI